MSGIDRPEDEPAYKEGEAARIALKDKSACPYSMPRVAVAGKESEAGYRQNIIKYHLWMAGYNDTSMKGEAVL